MIVPEALAVTLPRVSGPRWFYCVICVESRLVVYEGVDEDRAVDAVTPGTVFGKAHGLNRKACRRLARSRARANAEFARSGMEAING